MFLTTYQDVVNKAIGSKDVGRLILPFGGIILKAKHFKAKKEEMPVLSQIWDQCSNSMLNLEERFQEFGLNYSESKILANKTALITWDFGRNLSKAHVSKQKKREKRQRGVERKQETDQVEDFSETNKQSKF